MNEVHAEHKTPHLYDVNKFQLQVFTNTAYRKIEVVWWNSGDKMDPRWQSGALLVQFPDPSGVFLGLAIQDDGGSGLISDLRLVTLERLQELKGCPLWKMF